MPLKTIQTLTTEPLIVRAPVAADFPAFARLLASGAQGRAWDAPSERC
jgi:hypothetical protein